jgi:hypothetical protein
MKKFERKKLLKKINIVLLVIIAIIIAFNLVKFYNIKKTSNISNLIIINPVGEIPNLTNTQPSCKPTKIINTCSSDSDCSWMITNCCGENSGATWECLNKNSYISCCEIILCPQIPSPKPIDDCVCVNNICSVKIG